MANVEVLRYSIKHVYRYILSTQFTVDDSKHKDTSNSVDRVAYLTTRAVSLRWRHNGHDSVSNHQPHGCLLNRLFRRRSKKTSKFRVTGLCVGNSPGTGEFPAQMASNADNVSIWSRHHVRDLSRTKGKFQIQLFCNLKKTNILIELDTDILSNIPC